MLLQVSKTGVESNMMGDSSQLWQSTNFMLGCSKLQNELYSDLEHVVLSVVYVLYQTNESLLSVRDVDQRNNCD